MPSFTSSVTPLNPPPKNRGTLWSVLLFPPLKNTYGSENTLPRERSPSKCLVTSRVAQCEKATLSFTSAAGQSSDAFDQTNLVVLVPPLRLSTVTDFLSFMKMVLVSPNDGILLLSPSCPAGMRKFHISWSSVRFCVPPEAQSESVASLSNMTVGLFIIGRMWSPLCRVKLSPFRFFLQSLMSTGLFRESTSTGVAVLPLGPLLLVAICSTVLGM